MRQNASLILSYMHLRALIGILGMLLPVMCYVWCGIYNGGSLPDSISMFYYTNFRDIFVGVLLAFSVFLITYKGYDILDNAITVIIGVCGIGIALFPCQNNEASGMVSFLMLPNSKTSILHYSSAGAFFTLLSFNSLFLFTKSRDTVRKGTRKYCRNALFIACGIIILLSLIGMLIAFICTTQEYRDESHILFILETVMLLSFGVSWIVKGGVLMHDRKR